MPDHPTRAEQRILDVLADRRWHPEPELRSAWWFLQRMYLHGLIDGAMLTTGGTPADRLWRLTDA